MDMSHMHLYTKNKYLEQELQTLFAMAKMLEFGISGQVRKIARGRYRIPRPIGDRRRRKRNHKCLLDIEFISKQDRGVKLNLLCTAKIMRRDKFKILDFKVEESNKINKNALALLQQQLSEKAAIL